MISTKSTSGLVPARKINRFPEDGVISTTFANEALDCGLIIIVVVITVVGITVVGITFVGITFVVTVVVVVLI